MPILKRDDGVQFAIHAYRELLQPVKASLFREEIRMLAQSHGEYIRLFKLPTDEVEAVFSRDPGFLLGEAIWQYFKQPQDLIYCEALPEGHFAMVVVIRGGSVYLDTKIPYASISDEFASLVGPNKYDIYVYGDVPISETPARGKFSFDPTQIKSFTRLEKPLIRDLPVNESLQLRPLEFALRSQKMGFAIPRWAIYLLALIIIILIAWFLANRFQPQPEVAPPPAAAPAVPVDPYLGYKTFLMSPAPTRQIIELNNLLTTLYTLPGWQITQVTFDGANYTIPVVSSGGSIALLQQWASNYQMNLALSSAGATLTTTSKVENRSSPHHIYPLQKVLGLLIDRMHSVMAEPSITIGNVTAFGNYQTNNISIDFNNISPDVLVLIARQLTNLPIKLTSCQVSVNQGQLTGSIQLLVAGN